MIEVHQISWKLPFLLGRLNIARDNDPSWIWIHPVFGGSVIIRITTLSLGLRNMRTLPSKTRSCHSFYSSFRTLVLCSLGDLELCSCSQNEKYLSRFVGEGWRNEWFCGCWTTIFRDTLYIYKLKSYRKTYERDREQPANYTLHTEYRKLKYIKIKTN